MSPPISPQNANTQGSVPMKGMAVSVGKISLLAITFSLMLFGAFVFLSGFLLGMWFGGPETISFSPREKEAFTLGLLTPTQQAPVPQTTPVYPANGKPPQDFSKKVASAADDAITSAAIPGVPDFLAPLVKATQTAVGQQADHKIQQQAGRQLAQPISSSPQTPPPIGRLPQVSHPQPSSSQLPITGGVQHPVVVTPPSTPSSAPPSQTTGKEGYTIQLGVYAAKENADTFVNHMQALNYTSHIAEGKASDGSPLYYVHSGLYNDYTTALEAASQFVSQNIPGATVVNLSKEDKGAS